MEIANKRLVAPSLERERKYKIRQTDSWRHLSNAKKNTKYAKRTRGAISRVRKEVQIAPKPISGAISRFLKNF